MNVEGEKGILTLCFFYIYLNPIARNDRTCARKEKETPWRHQKEKKGGNLSLLRLSVRSALKEYWGKEKEKGTEITQMQGEKEKRGKGERAAALFNFLFLVLRSRKEKGRPV